jgi:hypothetical protein
MLSRLRSAFFAWTGALILALSASGLVAAATLVGDTAPTTDGQVTAPDASSTFVDTNGDGIADTCQSGVVADQAAADAALKAADTNGDGTISVSEAAHTDWIGGPNCNHGGYVSSVANAPGRDCSGGTPTGAGEGSDAGGSAGTTLIKSEGDQGSNGDEAGDATDSGTGLADQADQGDCSSSTGQTTDQTPTDQTPAPAACQAAAPGTPTTTTGGQAPTDTSPNAHGKAVSAVAQSAAVGGKNCNHGGAVSEAAKTNHGGGAQGHAGKQSHGQGHGKGHNKP